ncbi:NupC/NupG family nucleoside CNT transporter [Portibacter lacus]|uniref:Nucleoside transporter n=1 Tax=Portibacter lacus TaxID=1099794 RepID=A0AA37SLG8_9BACT|nr:nucleoside transporter C-terminal domain-containing protein [Portibacter lacus]GLR16307.1 nucleoside transporter [Portibacter lacus]
MEFLTDLSRGVLGIVVLILVCYLFSAKKREINWKLVGTGIGLQVLLALLLLKVPFINSAFDWIADKFAKLLQFSGAGAEFLFGNLITDSDSFGYIFAFQVLPTIVFFSAISSMLYYFGILQKVVYVLAWVMSKTMGLSGPESLATAANVFIGQTEAPLVVKPYLEKMTRSEILCLMTGGMATIAGGVFAAYIGFLGGTDPELQAYFAKHLLTASIISAPAAIVAAKILLPETKSKDISSQLEMEGSTANNVLDAISTGTTDGLKLAVNVGVMLLVFTALIALANAIMLKFVGSWTGLNDWVIGFTDGRFAGFDFTFILGVLFAPFAWILGTPSEDVLLVGQLLGQKTILNEFFAYAELNNLREAGANLSPKSLIIATYALCGFANFASIGIQIGGISAIAPGQRKNLTELGIKALIGGTIACFLTACIAGVLY